MQDHTFLRILKSALSEDSLPENFTLTTDDFGEIITLAEIHKVLPLVFEKVHHLCPFDKNATDALRSRVKLLVSGQILKTRNFLDLYSFLQSKAAEPLIVKGILCRNLYPNPDLRISSDEDMLISADEYDKYHSLLKSASLFPPHEDKAHYQTSFVSDNGLHIELHKALFDPQTDLFTEYNNIFSTASERSVYVNIDGVKIRTLSHTDHLLYLILHSLKHFIHSGVGIRQVCDIVLFSNKYGNEVDWDVLFSHLCYLHADKFAIGLFAIGEKHLVFDKEKAGLPKNINLDDIDETSLLEDIMTAGIYGGASMARQHSSGMTFSAVQGKKSGFFRKAFPSLNSLDHRYSYAKKCPLLLPVAWIHRLINYKKETSYSNQNNPAATLNIGKKRISLLQEYGLIPPRKS